MVQPAVGVPVYPVVFIDAIFVKVRDGQVTNRPIYVAIGVTCAAERDILGLWAGDGGEGAKFWLSVLTEIKNRGTADVCIVVCDGLKGLPEAINTVWSRAVVQTYVIHLLRNTFRYTSRKYWDQIAKDIRPVYTAGDRGRGQATLHRVHRHMGRPVPGDHAAVGERLERVRAVPGLPRRDPPHHLLHKRGGITECPLPAGDSGPRTLPNRTGRDEVPLPGDPIPRPHRPR
jgi:putative transposase